MKTGEKLKTVKFQIIQYLRDMNTGLFDDRQCETLSRDFFYFVVLLSLYLNYIVLQ